MQNYRSQRMMEGKRSQSSPSYNKFINVSSKNFITMETHGMNSKP